MGVPDHSVVHLPARDEVMHAFSDHTKAREVFGLEATTDLETGIGKMVDWAKERGPMKPSRFSGIEIEKNLPPSWL
jgi:UDP-glucose 4-epimerase